MTFEEATASGDRVAEGNLSSREMLLEPFKGRNVWTEHLLYFDIIWQSINDLFHELTNTLRDIFNLMRSSNKDSQGMHFSQKRREWENGIGRFIPHPGRRRAPFQCSLATQNLLDNYVTSGLMRLPSSWPRIRYIFQNFNRLSCSEILYLGGPLGLYFLHFCDVAPEIKKLFTELIICLEYIQAKEHTASSLDKTQVIYS